MAYVTERPVEPIFDEEMLRSDLEVKAMRDVFRGFLDNFDELTGNDSTDGPNQIRMIFHQDADNIRMDKDVGRFLFMEGIIDDPRDSYFDTIEPEDPRPVPQGSVVHDRTLYAHRPENKDEEWTLYSQVVVSENHAIENIIIKPGRIKSSTD